MKKAIIVLSMAVLVAALSSCGSVKTQGPRCSKKNKSSWNRNFINGL
jgi:hypothetical protein